MIKWVVKKFVLGKLNKLLDQYKEKTSKAQETLLSWLKRLRRICGLLEKLLGRLEDNSLSPEEAEATVEDIKTLVKEWQ